MVTIKVVLHENGHIWRKIKNSVFFFGQHRTLAHLIYKFVICPANKCQQI